MFVTIAGREAIEQALKQAPRVFYKHMRQGLKDTGLTFQNEFAARHLKGGTTEDRLRVRTGMLRRSWGHTLKGDSIATAAVHMGFGPPAQPFAGGAQKYAQAHVEGATITPKHGRFLAIPVAEGLTRAGAARFRSPRDVPGGFFVRLGSKLFMFWPKTKRKSVLVFRFVRKVVIPSRLPVGADWDAFQPRAFRRLDVAAEDAIAEAWAARAQAFLPGI